jgi:hypothetical protein
MREERMDDIKENEFQKELELVIEKFGVKYCSFCGSDDEGKMIGVFLGKPTRETIFNYALNVGRMWQHTRGAIREELNTYDKKNW